MSGWCESLGVADQWHDVCADRIRRGLITTCPCPAHANDESRYQVEPQTVNTSGTIGGKERAPDRVLGGPQSGALADYEGVDCA